MRGLFLVHTVLQNICDIEIETGNNTLVHLVIFSKSRHLKN